MIPWQLSQHDYPTRSVTVPSNRFVDGQDCPLHTSLIARLCVQEASHLVAAERAGCGRFVSALFQAHALPVTPALVASGLDACAARELVDCFARRFSVCCVRRRKLFFRSVQTVLMIHPLLQGVGMFLRTLERQSKSGAVVSFSGRRILLPETSTRGSRAHVFSSCDGSNTSSTHDRRWSVASTVCRVWAGDLMKLAAIGVRNALVQLSEPRPRLILVSEDQLVLEVSPPDIPNVK